MTIVRFQTENNFPQNFAIRVRTSIIRGHSLYSTEFIIKSNSSRGEDYINICNIRSGIMYKIITYEMVSAFSGLVSGFCQKCKNVYCLDFGSQLEIGACWMGITYPEVIENLRKFSVKFKSENGGWSGEKIAQKILFDNRVRILVIDKHADQLTIMW